MMSPSLEDWTTDDVEGFGRRVYEETPVSKRPCWAAELLDLCTFASPEIPEVQLVIALGQKTPASEWAAAHAAFTGVRTLTLRNHRALLLERRLELLLYVAETSAKVIYNASGRSAPFDYHAGLRMAPRL